MDFRRLVSFAELGIDRRIINGELRSPDNVTMHKLLGCPRKIYDNKCRRPTNKHIISQIIKMDVGPFEVTGLRPAVETLGLVFADVKRSNSELYQTLGSAGMICCRLMRGSERHISNHAWGVAIDIRINGVLDKVGDECTQIGLLLLYEYFNKRGFVWGASFPVEDSMHFEASEQLLHEWVSEGRLRSSPSETQHLSVHRAYDEEKKTVDAHFNRA